MASAGRARAYSGGLGCAPSGVKGQSPWSGAQGRTPPEACLYFSIQFSHSGCRCCRLL